MLCFKIVYGCEFSIDTEDSGLNSGLVLLLTAQALLVDDDITELGRLDALLEEFLVQLND